MNYIVDHESSYDKTEVGDTYLICKRTGRRMKATGLVQINNCYWPKITEAQTLNEDFALNFLGYWLSKGKCRYWSTCPVSHYLAIN